MRYLLNTQDFKIKLQKNIQQTPTVTVLTDASNGAEFDLFTNQLFDFVGYDFRKLNTNELCINFSFRR